MGMWIYQILHVAQVASGLIICYCHGPFTLARGIFVSVQGDSHEVVINSRHIMLWPIVGHYNYVPLTYCVNSTVALRENIHLVLSSSSVGISLSSS